MKTNVYFDGFNFYYGMFAGKRNLPWKWTDLLRLSQRLLPNNSINRIRYFTADVKPTPQDRNKAVRQQTYIRALETIPCLTVHKGTFLSNTRRQRTVQPITMPTLNPPLTSNEETAAKRVLSALTRVNTHYTEEKGSDVNLASYLLLDAFDQDCDAAVIISNDSDLAFPVETIRDRFGLHVTVFNPHPGQSTAKLQQSATQWRRLRPGNLQHCLFPDPVYDASGRAINKPSEWAAAEAAFRSHT